LGDGCISRHPRTYRLRYALDAKYPGIVDRCARTLEVLRPDQTAGRRKRPDCRCIDVWMYSTHWPCYFPQHAPGKKHERSLTLLEWQQKLVSAGGPTFLEGLLHSDGCRVVALDRGVRSIRYHFTNKSSDIRQMFCEALESFDIHWTQNSPFSIAVYRQADTASLDGLIAPKA
jgi:hypothetical protein